jgi:bifunctional aromatase (cyclase/dehydratase)
VPRLSPPAALPATDALYSRISQFYAWQMRLLDEGAAEAWADTFTEDAVFDETSMPEPVRGRVELALAARRRVDQLAEQGRTRRHWLGMLEVAAAEDGTVQTSYYALALSTPPGGMPEVIASTVAEDILVHTAEGWQVQRRTVRQDGRL